MLTDDRHIDTFFLFFFFQFNVMLHCYCIYFLQTHVTVGVNGLIWERVLKRAVEDWCNEKDTALIIQLRKVQAMRTVTRVVVNARSLPQNLNFKLCPAMTSHALVSVTFFRLYIKPMWTNRLYLSNVHI